MPFLTAAQRNHVARVIKSKRNQLFGYAGGNRKLAELIGVSPQLVSMWAYNKRTPGQQELLKLSEVFDISLDDLCRLNKPGKKPVRVRKKEVPVVMNREEVRASMLKICDITTDLVDRQRQMLHGEIDAKEHEKVLSRIKKYIDIV